MINGKKPVIALAWSHYAPGRFEPRTAPPAIVETVHLDVVMRMGEAPRPQVLYQREPAFSEALDRYLKLIMNGGGIPFVLPMMPQSDSIGEILDRCDGVLLSGGDDLSPSFFSESPLFTNSLGNLERTWHETAVVREAVARKMPLFGVCRGFQQLAVNFGGALIQDIPSQCPSELRHYSPDGLCYHEVVAEAVGELFPRLPEQPFMTNSWHHQVPKSIGDGTVIARAGDGIIEAAEWPKYNAFGVQWHPERVLENTVSDSLISSFVDRCRDYRG